MEVDGAPKKKEKQLPAEPNTSPDCPCAHNDWDNVRVKKGFITLRCRQCQAQWKTEMGSVKKCFKFFQGMCRRGAACPLPHIHRYKQSLEKRQTIFGENLDEDPPSVPATPDKRRRHKKSPSPAASHASSPRNDTMASTVHAHFPATNHLAPHHGYMGGVPVLHVQSPDHSQMSLGGLHPLALADAQLHNAPAPEEMRRESGASIWSASSMMWSEPGLTCDGSLASSPPMSPSNRRHKLAARSLAPIHVVVNDDGTTDVASNAGDEEDAPGLGHVMTEREVDEMNASFGSCGSCAQRYIPTRRAEKQAEADRSLNDLCSYPSNSSGLLTPAHVPLHHPGPGPLPGTGIYSLTPVTQPMAPAGQPPPMMASPPPQVPLPGPAAPLTHLHPTASGAPPSPYYGNAPSPHGHHVSLQHLHSPGNVSPCHMPPQPQTQVNVSPMAQQPMPVAGPVSPPPRRQGQYQPYALDATS
eukprot:TRINITY_DN183_c0_g1_i12.p1 TRINITY_DN183_c0_g1~~TRINITY_DN183_c0_g1_i12.p1  ORF type:complete len:487 (+),score=128.40 TRINITY_DN183_c0_g1_i12:54-1463(+)